MLRGSSKQLASTIFSLPVQQSKNVRNYTRLVRSLQAPAVVNVSVRNFSDANNEKLKKLSDEILSLSVLEMNQLLNAMKGPLGITDDMLANVGTGGPSVGKAAAEAPKAKAAEPEKPKDIFGIKIGAVDAKAKIKIIKEVRTITGLGLKEAKELVEKAPVTLKEGVKKEEAEAFKKLLIEAGATVELF